LRKASPAGMVSIFNGLFMETASKDGKFSFWIREALFLVPLHADAEAAK